jgi:replication fork protection complex subunit Tof1/Swi1
VRPDTEEQATALVYNPHLKLLCTLVQFEQSIPDEPEGESSKFCLSDASAGQRRADQSPRRCSEITWTVPKGLLPQEIESSIRIIEGFMREPMDLNGITPAELLRRKRRKRPAKRRRRDSVDVERAPRRRKQADEVQQKKSAQFIDDSDDDPEADAAFFAREAANREANRKNISLGFTKSSRQQPENDQRSLSHLVQDTNQALPRSASGQDDDESVQSDNTGPSPVRQVPGVQRPRPRARQSQKRKRAAESQSLVGRERSHPPEFSRSDEDSEDTDTVQRVKASARKRVVAASSEEDEADL